MSKDREAFFWRMGSWGVPLDRTRAVLRFTATATRLSVEDCNRQLEPREVKRLEGARAAVAALIRRQWPRSVVVTDGDPRGAVVKFQRTPGESGDSFGGDGWIVPAGR